MVLPRNTPGIFVAPPLELMALQGSVTAEVRLEQVTLAHRWLLAGPAERVLATGREGPGGLETSCLALGLAGAAIDFLAQQAIARSELRESLSNLELDRCRVRRDASASRRRWRCRRIRPPCARKRTVWCCERHRRH